MDRLNRIIIDSSATVSDMCKLGTEFGTDKSPYFYSDDPAVHRHPYTAVYDLLFSGLRYQHIVFGEFGVLDNMSMNVWRNYFPNATLYGFEFIKERIENAKAQRLPRTHYVYTDVGDVLQIFESLNSTGEIFDVLIDDSTHLYQDQINFINVAVDFVKPGGALIVEDIFRDWPEQRFSDDLRPIFPYFSSGTFIVTNHDQRYSDGSVEPWYNNDKLLVLRRNEVVRTRSHPDGIRRLKKLQNGQP